MRIKYNTYFLPSREVRKIRGISKGEAYYIASLLTPANIANRQIEVAENVIKTLEKKKYTINGILTEEYFNNNEDFLENIIEELKTFIEDCNPTASELDRLIRVISPIREEKTKKKRATTFNLESTSWNGPLRSYIKKELEKSRDGMGVKFDVGAEINEAFIEEKALKTITEKWVNNGTIPLVNGLPAIDNNIIKIIIDKLEKMFAWHEEKNKTIKNLKSTINTFFSN